jgi:D-serine deaminase-like pyridoxal phosphate-dependent protein
MSTAPSVYNRAMDVWPRYLLSGHAKLPQDAVARSVYEILTVVVTVNPETGTILDVGCSMVTRPAQEFVHQLLLGVSLDDPPQHVFDLLQKYYLGGSRKALAAAIRDLYNSWVELRSGTVKNTPSSA